MLKEKSSVSDNSNVHHLASRTQAHGFLSNPYILLHLNLADLGVSLYLQATDLLLLIVLFLFHMQW